MLKLVSIDRENKKEHDIYYSIVTCVNVRCFECNKDATIVTLPPEGKDLTVVCRDCLDSIVVDAIRLASIEMPFESCCYDSYCYDWLTGC